MHMEDLEWMLLGNKTCHFNYILYLVSQFLGTRMAVFGDGNFIKTSNLGSDLRHNQSEILGFVLMWVLGFILLSI